MIPYLLNKHDFACAKMYSIPVLNNYIKLNFVQHTLAPKSLLYLQLDPSTKFFFTRLLKFPTFV